LPLLITGVLVRTAQDGSIERLELLGSYGRPQTAFSTFALNLHFTSQIAADINTAGVRLLFLHFMQVVQYLEVFEVCRNSLIIQHLFTLERKVIFLPLNAQAIPDF
jgi:hypothetical protein